MKTPSISPEATAIDHSPSDASIREAFSHCESVVRTHYENFPVGSRFIPKGLRPHVCSIYAFARAADDFADEPGLKPAQRLRCLDRWQNNLDACLTEPKGPVFTALSETIRAFDLPTQLLEDLLSAFRLDVTTSRHETFEDLLSYCRYSANPVGRLVLHLFGYRDERRCLLSDAICSGLQLTNFWQDISVDASRGRIYIPQDDMRRFAVTEEDLAKKRVTPGFCRLLDLEIARTEALFSRGRCLSETVTGRLRLELRAICLGGQRILDKIRHNDYDVFDRRPRITAWDRACLLLLALRPRFPGTGTTSSDTRED